MGADFTGIGVIFGFLLTAAVFVLISLVSFAIGLAKKSEGSKHKAYRFTLLSLFLLVLNVLGFLFYFALYESISHALKETFDPLMILGWLPANLVMLFVANYLIHMKNKA